MLSTTELIGIAVLVALLAVATFALMRRSSHRRHLELKRRFGPEYDRAIEQHGNTASAERELRERERRVHSQRLRPLSEADRVQYASDWSTLQARFVDDPSGAVGSADELIKVVMLARGYSNESFERRVEDLSVEHAHVVDHYRAAHELADANREGRAETEDLRQALVHYRALFAALLEAPRSTQPQLQEARA
jgi:hypothetical protein